MTRRISLLLTLVALVAGLWAQTPAGAPPGGMGGRGAAGGSGGRGGRGGFGGPAIKSHEVMPDRSVTFRFSARNANAVTVRIGGQTVTLQKNEQGIWTGASAPLAPDIYDYTFNVDGLSVTDPNNPDRKTGFNTLGTSLVTVTGSEPMSWDITDVPHGSVNHHFYKSGIIGDQRDYYVYTPPNYDAKRAQPYPVLFLLHGLTDDASSWNAAGHANFILDNLIAQAKAQPMIMVNGLGYGDPSNIGGGAAAAGNTSFEKYINSLLTEVVPQLEKTYNVSKDRSQRAIAGLSMGGVQSLFGGLNHLDKFAYVGAFSAAFPMLGSDFTQVFPSLDAKANAQLKMLWIACGTEDTLLGGNRAFKEWLKTKNVTFTDIETPGAHAWPVWRNNLTNFAPLLFQKAGK